MLQRYIRALADSFVIVLIIPWEWYPLGAVARMGSAPSFLVIALRTANRHFWRCRQGLTIPSDCAKKCQQISNLDRVHQLIYISSHSPPSLRKYKWHPGILPGKMLQRYSVRLWIYSWFMKYCHPKLMSTDVIAGDVGRRQGSRRAMLLSRGSHKSCISFRRN